MIHPAISRLLADIASAARTPIDARDRHMAAALAPHLGDPALLQGLDCPCNPDRYTRHLLHNDPEAGYAAVVIAWAPGQMSPVHGHHTWCAFGVQYGWLTETFFRPDGATARPISCLCRRPGDVGHAAADPAAIHRIANLGTEPAYSLHVYGVPYDRFAQGVNAVWAA